MNNSKKQPPRKPTQAPAKQPNDPQWPGDRKQPGAIPSPSPAIPGVTEKTVIPLVR